MHFIKLDAIGSTNDFLKDLVRSRQLENFTVVTAETQTSGRGQRGTTWSSESGKNLTMSVFCRTKIHASSGLFVLNAATAIAILEAIRSFGIPDLSVKWPNDIMSGRSKIGGILIENNVKTAADFESVIGIGINVNQVGFESLPNASSMFLKSGREFDKEQVAVAIASELEAGLSDLETHVDEVWIVYNENLFRKGQPTVFEDNSGARFNGIIEQATRDGLLTIRLEDDSMRIFGIKEVAMLY